MTKKNRSKNGMFYLNEKVFFGGAETKIGNVYKWFKRNGHTERDADYWLMGYQYGHNVTEKNEGERE